MNIKKWFRERKEKLYQQKYYLSHKKELLPKHRISATKAYFRNRPPKYCKECGIEIVKRIQGQEYCSDCGVRVSREKQKISRKKWHLRNKELSYAMYKKWYWKKRLKIIEEKYHYWCERCEKLPMR